jgi:hypothetical protein
MILDKFKNELRDMRNISLGGILVAMIFGVIIIFSFGQMGCP